MFRCDEVRLSGQSFTDFAKADGVVLGATVIGAVRETASDAAYVRIRDVDAELPRHEIAWGFRGHPSWLLSTGGAIQVTVLEVEDDRCVVRVSAKRLRPSPWGMPWQPKRNERVKGEVVGVDEEGHAHIRVRLPQGTEGDLYGHVPANQWTWYSPGDPRYSVPEPGAVAAFRVVGASATNDDLHLSRATLDERDWATINTRFQDGWRGRAKVIHVDYDGVRCELEDGVFGRVDRTELVAAGFEYADYTNTMVAGQSIDVVVIGRRSGRQFLKLDLQRNQTGEQAIVPG